MYFSPAALSSASLAIGRVSCGAARGTRTYSRNLPRRQRACYGTTDTATGSRGSVRSDSVEAQADAEADELTSGLGSFPPAIRGATVFGIVVPRATAHKTASAGRDR